MHGRTHFVLGILVGLVFAFLNDLEFSLAVPVLFFSIFGSMIADVDIITSPIGKRVKIVGFIFKHRGAIHSVWFGLLVLLIIYLITPVAYFWLVFFLSFLLHLALDSMTLSGISPCSCQLWSSVKMIGEMVSSNCLKNSAVKPSGPGAFPFGSSLIACWTSKSVMGAERMDICVSVGLVVMCSSRRD